MLYLELAIVTVLIVINGLLSMSELAIVSSRPARLARPGREGRPRLAARAGARLRSRKIPLHRADRHHADRRALGRVLRRHARPAAVAMAGRTRPVARPGRRHRRRPRRRHHHLCLADRRRTRAEADRAARSRIHRRQGRAGDERDGEDLAAAGVAARPFRQGAALAARPSRRGRRSASARRKSARWWSRPNMPACSSPARRK